jgi:hypothetical protein
MKVQLLFLLQVTAYSTLCQTNLHPSTAWGDFIKRPAFFRIIKIKFVIGVVEDQWIKLVHSTCIWKILLCVVPIRTVDDGPQAADDTSIN